MEALAKEIDGTKASFANFENSNKKPSLDALVAIANFFDVSLDYLVGRSDCPHILRDKHVEIVSPGELELLRRYRKNH